MKILIARYGGIGDTVIMRPVAAALKRKYPGAHVTLAVAADMNAGDYRPLFDLVPDIDLVIPMYRPPGDGASLVDDGCALVAPHALRDSYDEIHDFYHSIESNGKFPHLAEYAGGWMETQNSNYQNWIDLSLGWANIDPDAVEPNIKRPHYVVTQEERAWSWNMLEKDIEKYGRPVAIQTDSSALSRTWFKDHSLIKTVREDMKRLVLLWMREEKSYWLLRPSQSRRTVLGPPEHVPEGVSHLRQSMALMSQCEGIICMDSGMSHLCEGAGIPGVAIYPTIPSWTRTQYYQFIMGLDPDGPSCRPCFVLGDCPERKRRAPELLAGRDKTLYDMFDGANADEEFIAEAAERLQTTIPALQQEIGALNQKLAGYAQLEPYCLEGVTTERIIDAYRSHIRRYAFTGNPQPVSPSGA